MKRRIISVVPNVLSSLRICLACCFWLIPEPWRLLAVIAGGASDWLDGLVARKFGATSVAGGLLDAIADKMLTFAVLLTLAAGGVVAWWQVPIVLVRDLTVASLAAYALLIGRRDAFGHMPAKVAGKLTTVLLFVWFTALLISVPPLLSWSLFGVVGGASLLAGADYLGAFLQRPPEFRGGHRTR
ncbi:MAG: CDP-alcohol phosphatidyltransferase family protein [Planctomycetota bacterium]